MLLTEFVPHEQGCPIGKPRLARFSFGAGRAALPARIPDGWTGAGCELAGALLYCELRHSAVAPQTVRRSLSKSMDAGRFAAGGDQPQCAGKTPTAREAARGTGHALSKP